MLRQLQRELSFLTQRFQKLCPLSFQQVAQQLCRLQLRRLTGGLLLMALVSSNGLLAQSTQDASQLFQSYQDRLFQIRTIDIASGSKASIGSGFAIDSEGTIATNYHVVSKYILHPDEYYLEALTFDKKKIPIDVISIDVVNDLALVKLDSPISKDFLSLAISEPQKGEQIFSLGNPRDLGMTVVPGTFNGRTAHSYYGRILFSGSVNPGMSGGPVINNKGEVIGVNVATSGNQISFLVPLDKLKQLLETGKSSEESLSEQAYDQLKTNQNLLMQRLFEGQWQPMALGDAQVIGELTGFISCWGESNKRREEQFNEVYRRCKNSEYIYIAPDFYTGIIEMEFFWYESEKLSNWQFYKMLNDSFASASAGNMAGEEHVTEFSCDDEFVQSDNSKHISKTIYCVREYKQFPGLYDVLFLSSTVNLQQKALVSHYTISGIEQKQAEQFLKRFMEQVQ
ncbi:trypsin-like peptidase [Pleionea mediterranea]|uniref:Trypsin-like peptidase n=1 Tax=Pleionea mediterranea TaxID=523701 RepID=A0A316G061_9GAMM|nr:trypsin-like peptidase [Pleionea mediterranea]